MKFEVELNLNTRVQYWLRFIQLTSNQLHRVYSALFSAQKCSVRSITKLVKTLYLRKLIAWCFRFELKSKNVNQANKVKKTLSKQILHADAAFFVYEVNLLEIYIETFMLAMRSVSQQKFCRSRLFLLLLLLSKVLQ